MFKSSDPLRDARRGRDSLADGQQSDALQAPVTPLFREHHCGSSVQHAVRKAPFIVIP